MLTSEASDTAHCEINLNVIKERVSEEGVKKQTAVTVLSQDGGSLAGHCTEGLACLCLLLCDLNTQPCMA